MNKLYTDEYLNWLASVGRWLWDEFEDRCAEPCELEEIRNLVKYVEAYKKSQTGINIEKIYEELADWASQIGEELDEPRNKFRKTEPVIEFPIAKRVYASTIPNPDYVDPMLLLLNC